MRRLVGLLALVWTAGAVAETRPQLALLRLEPLGLDAARAAGLDALFRAEIERVAHGTLVPRPTVDALLEKEPSLRACTGAPACLSTIGRRLGVSRIVWGNVAELGDSYVVSLRLVDVARGVEERRVEERLRGNADELIEAVRVAAHRLLDPGAVRGALAITSDVLGARVVLDGKAVGRTPLPPIADLPVGTHQVRLEATGYLPFESEVTVRFQKSSEVSVTLVSTGGVPPPPPRAAPSWLASPWTWVAIGAAAVLTGVVVGRALSPDPIIDCGASPGRCP